ncbi:MAG: tetratricopeptide repeat protein [Saprospiraceae bacterium]
MKRLFFLIIVTNLLFTNCQDSVKATKTNTPIANLPTTGNPAIDGLSVAIADNPNDPSLYAKRADMFYQNEGYDEAIIDLQRALSFDSTNVEYLHLLADVYLDYYQSYPAINTMMKAATLYPTRIPTLLKLSEFQLILKQYDKSINTINEVLRLEQLNAEAYFMLGLNFKEQGDIDRAMGSFQTAVENNPDLVDAWINLGQLHAEKGSKLAKFYFENAVKVAPDNITALHAKAEFLHFSDDRQGAIETYRQINAIDPDYSESFFNTGIIYLEMDSLAEAKKHFNMAVETSPTYIIAYYYRGLVLEMEGNIAGAKKDYQTTLNFNPAFERAQEALERLK